MEKTEGTYISVCMYKDRIEITNPGGLYGANKLEKLDSANLMETRNPNIVRILEEKGNVIENRHTGISTMKREMQKYNLPEPEFYEENSFFRVTFRNNIQFNIEGGHQSDTQSDLNKDVMKKVLEYCKEAKTAKEIREYLGISSKRYAAYNILRPMIEKGILEYTNKNNKNAKNQKYITRR